MPHGGEKRRIVVLSDVHFGDLRSTLRDPRVVDELLGELNQDKKVDELVLLGDLLDVTLSGFHYSVEEARKFFDRIRSLDVRKIIYIPGNHDYHIWLLHIEKRDIIEVIQNRGLPGLPEYVACFSNRESFFSEVLPENLRDKFEIRYPNYEFENKGFRCFFHHGHQVYGPGVLLMAPGAAIEEGKGLNDLLMSNSPILDLIYYHIMHHERIRDEWEDALTKYGLAGAIDVLIRELTRGKNSSLMKRLITPYAVFALRRTRRDRQTRIDVIENEIRDYLKLCSCQPQGDLCFIFGHSHVPEGKKTDENLTVVNSGSWLKEDNNRHNTYVLIEDNVVTLRRLGENEPIFQTHQCNSG